MDWHWQIQLIFEVAFAMVLGGLIGIEREFAAKPAGFRTHMLVAGAAALLVGLGDAILQRFSALAPTGLVRSDPIRIVEAVVTGISFLGAGTIFRSEGRQVEGLTTAATILLASAIGISVALRQYFVAVGVTILALVVLRGLRFLDKKATR